jgi:hypothetical protein
MNYKQSILVLLLGILCGGVVSYGQELGPSPKRARTLEDYHPRTLKEISARVPNDTVRVDENGKVILLGDTLPSRVGVTYVGRRRPLPQAKKDVLSGWAQLYAGTPEHYTKPYERELLFRDGKKDYWVAIRKQSITQFNKVVKKGTPVDLYLIRLGWTGIADGWEPLLLMENFRVTK